MNYDFGLGVAQRAHEAQRQDKLNNYQMLMNAVNSFKDDRRYADQKDFQEREFALKEAQLSQPKRLPMNERKMNAVMRYQAGERSPELMAEMQAFSALDQGKMQMVTDEYGNVQMRPQPSAFDILMNSSQGFNPEAPTYNEPLEYLDLSGTQNSAASLFDFKDDILDTEETLSDEEFASRVTGSGLPEVPFDVTDKAENSPKTDMMRVEANIEDKLDQRKTKREIDKKEKELELSALTDAQKAVDKQFAEIYADYTLKGGYADTQKQIEQLNSVHQRLLSGEEDLTGLFLGAVPANMRAAFNEGSVDAQNLVEEVVQRSLRTTLGAQFTEKEGERLISRAYNPMLSEKINAERVGRLIKQLTDAAKTKQDAINYFNENGTINGWDGRLPTIDDFDPTAGQSKKRYKYNPQTGMIE